jgi:hypothetical protein
MDTVKDSEGKEYDPQDPAMRRALIIGVLHSVHLLIEQLPDPRAVEMLKAWSKIVRETEEETNSVLWFVQATPRPLRPGQAGDDEMLKRWTAQGPSRQSASDRGEAGR